MKRAWQTLTGYIWWTHERGTLHYDVMVILILAFIFLTPLWVNFKDKPAERNPHPTEVVVYPDSDDRLVYEIGASAASGANDAQIRASLLRVIEPLAGEVELLRYQKMHDRQGRLIYKTWVRRR